MISISPQRTIKKPEATVTPAPANIPALGSLAAEVSTEQKPLPGSSVTNASNAFPATTLTANVPSYTTVIDEGHLLHGCARTVKDDNTQQVVVGFPTKGAHASNAGVGQTDIHINGMRYEHADIAAEAAKMANFTGKPVVGIVNPKEANLLHSIWKAFLGIVSSYWGAAAEPDAVRNLKSEMQSQLEHGEKVNVLSHSHGAIITQNAISLLEKEVGPIKWRECRGNIHVTSYGIKLYGWPEGVRVEEHLNSKDYISKITGVISCIRNLWQGRATETIIVAGGSHGMENYMQREPLFMVERARNNGEIDCTLLAQNLREAIKSARISDAVAERIIAEAIKQGGSEFAFQFVKLGREEDKANGTISDNLKFGNYLVPEKLRIQLFRKKAESAEDNFSPPQGNVRSWWDGLVPQPARVPIPVENWVRPNQHFSTIWF